MAALFVTPSMCQSYLATAVTIKACLTKACHLYLSLIGYESWNLCQSHGHYSLGRHCIIRIGIPIINLRRSPDRLKFIMGIPLLFCFSKNRPRLTVQYSIRGEYLTNIMNWINIESSFFAEYHYTYLLFSFIEIHAFPTTWMIDKHIKI